MSDVLTGKDSVIAVSFEQDSNASKGPCAD